MREQASAAATSLSALISLTLAHAALAAPSASLVWTNCAGATCGAGVGTSSIVAGVGDTLTLDIVLHPDASGIAFAALKPGYDSNRLFGLSAQNCPSPPSAVPGACDGALPPPWPPLPIPIDNVGPGSTMGPFDAQWAFPTVVPSVTLGRATFSVQGPGAVSLVYGLNEGVIDGIATPWTPAASADVVPEPATAALLALGLCVLAAARAQRVSARARSASR